MPKIAFLCNSHSGIKEFANTFFDYFSLHFIDQNSSAENGSQLGFANYFVGAANFSKEGKKNLWAETIKILHTARDTNGVTYECSGFTTSDEHVVRYDIFQKDTIQKVKDLGFTVVKLKNLKEGVVLENLIKEFGPVLEEEIPNLTLTASEEIEPDYTYEFDFSDQKQAKKIILEILKILS